MSRSLRIVIVLALATVVVPPAAADTEDPCIDPETEELVLTEHQVYIHQAETKVGNLGAVGATDFPSWSEDAPDQSVFDGAGGGYAMPWGDWLLEMDEELTGLTVVGEFSGCLDTMLFDLYAWLPTNRTGTSGNLNESPFNGMVRLDIDGEQIAWPSEIEMNTVPNPDGDTTYHMRFAYTDIHESMTFAGLEPGGDHELRFNVVPRFANTSNAIFVYDTVEVPAGILFNGTPDDDYPALSAF